MYLALYRKYRPTTFDKIVGQEHVTKTLRNQILNDQIGHAYLFCGSRGTGKTTCAKVFARAINCQHPVDGSPCGECEVCKALKENNAIDIIEIDAASNNGVEEIRDLREKVKYPPTVGRYKVYIIDEVHMLTASAFNALLKTLEEPPTHAVFILATTEVHRLPATILSRVLRFDFKLINTQTIAKLLTDIFKQSNIIAEESAINLIATAGQGSVRDALSIADMCASFSNNNIKYDDVVSVLGVSDKQTIYNLGSAILEERIKDFFTEFTNIVKAGKNLLVTANDLTKFFRDLLVIKTCGDDLAKNEYNDEMLGKLKSLAEKFDVAKLNEAMQAFSQIEAELKYSLNPQLLIETTALGLLSAEVKKKLTIQASRGEIVFDKETKDQNLNQPCHTDLQKQTENSKNQDLQKQAENKDLPKQDDITPKPLPNERVLWGRMLLNIKKQGNILLHSVCVELGKVKLENQTLKIFVPDVINYETLKKPQNYNYLVDTLHKLGYNLNIELVLDETINNEQNKINQLEHILGVKIELTN